MTKTTSRIARIDHVQLAAPPGREAAARELCGATLGMKEDEKPGLLQSRGGCWFQCGDQQLHIGVEANFHPSKKARPALAVSGWDELRKTLAASGAIVIDEDNVPGTRRFYTADPWGNRVEFVDVTSSSPNFRIQDARLIG